MMQRVDGVSWWSLRVVCVGQKQRREPGGGGWALGRLGCL